jgi:hypothetical protein
MRTFATILPVGVLITQAVAQTPHTQLIKGTPTTRAFDISWVDNYPKVLSLTGPTMPSIS